MKSLSKGFCCAVVLGSALSAFAPAICAASPTPSPVKPVIAAPPAPDTIPTGPEGDVIRRGLDLVTHTPQLLPHSVGSSLACTNCHLNGGRTPNAMPWVGIYGQFPQYRPREGRVITVEGRVNECLRRSLNGSALGDHDPDMVAIVSYIAWLSRGVPVGAQVEGTGLKKIKMTRAPDPKHGSEVFQGHCASCHGIDGQGQYAAKGETVYPPLWGPRSFNIGAGMARLDTTTGFIVANMPQGQIGSITLDEAFDVAAFVSTQPRPDFAAKSEDWPHGGKPADARY